MTHVKRYEEVIEYLFYQGYQHEEIKGLLASEYGIEMSIRTLKRRLKDMNLSRKDVEYDAQEVRQGIQALLDGPNSCVGYRSMWHSLRLQGMVVPRIVVQKLMVELDPDGVERRKAHKLHRREYHNPGPNMAWHVDGYDKLAPYGFPIHGCIDGFSRKVLWLYVTRSNSYPDNIAAYYLDTVSEIGGCPRRLYTDLGTENGTMAGIQSFFTDDPDSHVYVPSQRNQRIEAWWSSLRKNWGTWWINFFKDFVEMGKLNTCDPLQKECLWFCFSSLIQADLNKSTEHWNTHYIRKSRHDTVSGRPNVLYVLPEKHGGINNLMFVVPGNELKYAKSHLIEREQENEYQEYFQYVVNSLNLQKPNHWREAVSLYERILSVAV